MQTGQPATRAFQGGLLLSDQLTITSGLATPMRTPPSGGDGKLCTGTLGCLVTLAGEVAVKSRESRAVPPTNTDRHVPRRSVKRNSAVYRSGRLQTCQPGTVGNAAEKRCLGAAITWIGQGDDQRRLRALHILDVRSASCAMMISLLSSLASSSLTSCPTEHW